MCWLRFTNKRSFTVYKFKIFFLYQLESVSALLRWGHYSETPGTKCFLITQLLMDMIFKLLYIYFPLYYILQVSSDAWCDSMHYIFTATTLFLLLLLFYPVYISLWPFLCNFFLFLCVLSAPFCFESRLLRSRWCDSECACAG